MKTKRKIKWYIIVINSFAKKKRLFRMTLLYGTECALVVLLNGPDITYDLIFTNENVFKNWIALLHNYKLQLKIRIFNSWTHRYKSWSRGSHTMCRLKATQVMKIVIEEWSGCCIKVTLVKNDEMIKLKIKRSIDESFI